jgi:hypothetical protein
LGVFSGIELEWNVHFSFLLTPSLFGDVAPYGRFVGRECPVSRAICRMLLFSVKYARRIFSRSSTLIISFLRFILDLVSKMIAEICSGGYFFDQQNSIGWVLFSISKTTTPKHPILHGLYNIV